MGGSIGGVGGLPSAVAFGAAGHAPRTQARILQQQLDKALDGIPAPTRLSLRADVDSGRIVVQVVDVQTGDVLRQIPHEDALAFAQEMRRTAGSR